MSSLTYSIYFTQPANHYVEVEIRWENFEQPASGLVYFKMPVWTPGSYLLREYARNVEKFAAWANDSQALEARKQRKNTWEIKLLPHQNWLKVTYRVYSFEVSVRNNFVDEAHALIVGANTFMYIEGFQHQPAQLEVKLPPQWTKIETALSEVAPHRFYVPDFDTLIDSPLELGNAFGIDFEVAGIPHRHVLYGLSEKQIDAPKLCQDTMDIVLAAQRFFGENPCERYLFVTHFLYENRGGLEHKNCTILQHTRDEFKTEEGYLDYLSLVAHEYFHVWNIKRLRPTPLGPFDYEQENYTTLLWQVEGFTSYYEKLILHKAKLIDEEAYLATLSKKINHIENQPGIQVQSIAEASWDAWIKAYRPNENSPNSSISYYTKGAVVAMMLDAFIIRHSQAQHSLDTVMQQMYQKYYKELDRPFTEEELKKALEDAAQKSMDDFFKDYIHGTQNIDYQAFIEPLGLALKIQQEKEEKTRPEIGFSIQKNKVIFVKRGSPAERDGLNVGDTLLAINGEVREDFSDLLSRVVVSENLTLSLQRDGLMKEINICADQAKTQERTLTLLPQLTKAQQKNQDKFFRRNTDTI